RGLRRFAVGKALGPPRVLVRRMHDTGEPAHGRDRARFLGRIGRHQLFFRKPPGEVSEYRRVLDKDLAVNTERRYFSPRVDLQIGLGLLLLLGEQDRLCLVRRAGFFETDMRGQRTSAGTEIERQHRNTSLLVKLNCSSTSAHQRAQHPCGPFSFSMRLRAIMSTSHRLEASLTPFLRTTNKSATYNLLLSENRISDLST